MGKVSSPPVPVLLYVVCTCLLRCLINLARSSGSWTALSFRAVGIRGNCLFFGLPVGVAVADLELNLECVKRNVLVFCSITVSFVACVDNSYDIPGWNVAVRVKHGSMFRRRQRAMTGGTLRPSAIPKARRVHRCCTMRPVAHHSSMNIVLGITDI